MKEGKTESERDRRNINKKSKREQLEMEWDKQSILSWILYHFSPVMHTHISCGKNIYSPKIQVIGSIYASLMLSSFSILQSRRERERERNVCIRRENLTVVHITFTFPFARASSSSREKNDVCPSNIIILAEFLADDVGKWKSKEREKISGNCWRVRWEWKLVHQSSLYCTYTHLYKYIYMHIVYEIAMYNTEKIWHTKR